MSDLQVPYDKIAESGVIGCCIASHSGYLLAATRLEPGDFYRPLHQELFKACSQLAHLDGADLDTRDRRVELAAELAGVEIERVQRTLDKRLTMTDKSGTLARRVKRSSEARRLMAAAADVFNRLSAGEPLETVLGDADASIRHLLTAGRPA